GALRDVPSLPTRRSSDLRLPPEEPFRRAIVLGVAFAANIGGMGTPIGSPPNAVALGHLRAAGLQPSFLEWMLAAVPLAAACLALDRKSTRLNSSHVKSSY